MAETKYINVHLVKNFIDSYPPPLIKTLLDSVPAADVVPVRRGRWIEKKKATDFVGLYEVSYVCSRCNNVVFGKYNYCSNCGAKMEGEEND